jgi:putative PIN family toxin of toxin-antitoxin system
VKVLIDTNILVSASLDSKGTPYQAYIKAVSSPNRGVVCEQIIMELRKVYQKKFPDKIKSLDRFLALALTTLDLIPYSVVGVSDENLIRDVSDRPILRAAIHAKVDILITGDKDLLESGISNPKIMTAAEFLKFLL